MATKLGTLTLDLVARIGSFTQGMRQASTTAEREMGRVQNSVVTVDGLIKKLAVTAGAVFSVGQITNYADAHIDIVNKLKLVTNSQEQLSTAMADTHKIAQDTASSWSAVNDVYSKYMSNSKILNLTQAETARLTEITSKAVAISGSTTQAAAGALFQYGQSLDGNILRAQEYNSLVDGAGGLLNAMAKGLNITRGELRQMMLDGKLTGKVITESLLKAGDSVDDLFSKTATTVSASFNLIKNEAIKVVGEFDGATGASKTFVEGMTLLSENMDVVTKAAGLMAAVYAGKVVSGYAASIVASVQQRAALTAEQAANVQLLGVQAQKARSQVGALTAERNLLIARIQQTTNLQKRVALEARATQVAIQLAVAERQLTAATAAYTTASTAAAGATTRLAVAKAMLARVGTGLLGALGGPVGLAVMLGTVAAGYLLTRDSTDESTKSLRENNESVEDAIKKYNELDEVKRRAQLVSEKESLRDLGKEYDDITAKLITAAYSFSRQNEMTTEQAKQVNALIAEYKKTGDIDEFSGKINALNFINQTSKDRFNTLGGAVKDAGNEFKNQKSFVEQMAPALKGTADQAKQSAVEVSGLSEELKKLFDQANQNLKNAQIAVALSDRGYSDEMIALAQKYLAVQGAIVKNEQGQWRLRPDVQKQFNEEWIWLQKQKNSLDKRNDADKERTKELEKHAKLIKASTIDAVISSGEGNYNSVNLGQKGGYKASTRNLTEMTVAQVLAAQDAKKFNAAGKYQVIPETLRGAIDAGVVSSAEKFSEEVQERIFKQYLVALKRPEIKGFITGNTGASLNDALSGTAKEFASVANPSTGKSYYAGVGNNKASISAEKMTESLLAQQKVYRENIALGMTSEQAWLKSFNASATVVKTEELDVDKFLEDMIKRKQEQAQKQKEIQLGVAAETVRIRTDLADKLKEIEGAGFDAAETARLKAEYTTRAENEIKIAESAHADKLAEYSAYVKTEEQLINESYDRRQRDLKLDLELTHDEYTQASLNLETMRKRELEAIRRDQALELLEVKRDWMNREQYAEEYYALVRAEILATANYSPEKKSASIKQANAQQGVDQAQQREGIWADYTDRFAPEQLPYDQDAALLKAARDEMLITEEEYQKQRLALQMTYGAQYGADFAGMMMGLVDSSSSAYAVLGAVQKGAALFSTAMNSYTAISAAWASAPFPYNLPAVGMATMETGLLQAAVSAMSPVGMAHDGIDNIPKEGTWLLDKGERVVDSRTNGDLKDYLAKGGSGGGNVTINQSINIASDGTATTQNDSKQLGALINNAVLAVIRKEQRQGGLLSK